ncbi:MAG: 4Fe-4S dicluster domain-containing protein [Thermodesulfobacteriota bacterium]
MGTGLVTIGEESLDPDFKFLLADIPGAEDIRRCFACGTCTGICPVSRENSGYDPRKIVHMVILGLKQRLLSSEMIWHCTHCDTCQFACPQGVRMSTVIDALRRMAVEGRYVDVPTLQGWGKVATIKGGRCAGCLTCSRVCPFEAIYREKKRRALVQVDPLKCRACGLCTAECPRGAIVIKAQDAMLAA